MRGAPLPPRAEPAPAWWWSALGKAFAVSVLHEEPLGLELAPSTCKLLLGADVGFEDLEAVRPEEFRALWDTFR